VDGFDWDDANRDHIAEHGVSTEEAEEAYLGETLFLDSYAIDGELRFEELGETATGRILKFMTVERGNLIRILTCFDAPSNLKQFYLRTMVKRYE
jgi:uncharacterized DUF497 family protein